jgi:hypothetical protein
MTDDGELCCEDCEFFQEASPWWTSAYGVCRLDGELVEATDDICVEFEGKYD